MIYATIMNTITRLRLSGRLGLMLWGLLSACVAIALLGYLYVDSLVFLFGQWESQDHSHGLFVPLISLLLIWQARHRIAVAGIRNSWWDLPLISAEHFLFLRSKGRRLEAGGRSFEVRGWMLEAVDHVLASNLRQKTSNLKLFTS